MKTSLKNLLKINLTQLTLAIQ